MSNKTNIEEDIEKVYDLFQWADDNNINTTKEYKSFENILADREEWKTKAEWFKRCCNKNFDTAQQLQTKANKYDSLVEKIRNNLREKEIIKECETISDREHLDGEIFALQELLDTES